MIPVSVIIVTKNEEHKITACLHSLSVFDDIWVVDSESRDNTKEAAKNLGAHIIDFKWNGIYPKKRGWCLDNLSLKYDWVFFVDADELVTNELTKEIEQKINLNPPEAGFFVLGRYIAQGKILKYGLPNNKIVLFHRDRMAFPVVDDVDIPGMGEIEGHYQPILKKENLKIGQLKNYIIHNALDDERAWAFRHEKYARWEAGMNARNAWPKDPIFWREWLKTKLRHSRIRPEIMFFVSFILKCGIFDGRAGYDLAKRKYYYYKTILRSQ